MPSRLKTPDFPSDIASKSCSTQSTAAIFHLRQKKNQTFSGADSFVFYYLQRNRLVIVAFSPGRSTTTD
jgi:hypothetical protein